MRRSSDDARCVVCMSGGMPTPAASGSLARVGGALIDEPFDAEKVRRVVDGSVGRVDAGGRLAAT